MAKATALRKVSKPVPGKAVGSQMNGCETATCIFTLAFFFDGASLVLSFFKINKLTYLDFGNKCMQK